MMSGVTFILFFSLALSVSAQTTSNQWTPISNYWVYYDYNAMPLYCSQIGSFGAVYSAQQCQTMCWDYGGYSCNSIAWSQNYAECYAYNCPYTGADPYIQTVNTYEYYYNTYEMSATTMPSITTANVQTTGQTFTTAYNPSGMSWQLIGENVVPRGCSVISVTSTDLWSCEDKCNPLYTECNAISYNPSNEECILRYCPQNPWTVSTDSANGFNFYGWVAPMGTTAQGGMTTGSPSALNVCGGACLLMCSPTYNECCYTCTNPSCNLSNDATLSMSQQLFETANGNFNLNVFNFQMYTGQVSALANEVEGDVWVGFVQSPSINVYFNATCV